MGEAFEGVAVAREVDAYQGGKLAVRIVVTKLKPAVSVDDSAFVFAGHEYKRQFTDEVR